MSGRVQELGVGNYDRMCDGRMFSSYVLLSESIPFQLDIFFTGVRFHRIGIRGIMQLFDVAERKVVSPGFIDSDVDASFIPLYLMAIKKWL